MEVSMTIEVKQAKSNGGEFFVYTDGSLMGVYAHIEKVAERLSEEVARVVLEAAQEEDDDELEGDGALCSTCRVAGHDVCSMTDSCPCCADTAAQLRGDA